MAEWFQMRLWRFFRISVRVWFYFLFVIVRSWGVGLCFASLFITRRLFILLQNARMWQGLRGDILGRTVDPGQMGVYRRARLTVQALACVFIMSP